MSFFENINKISLSFPKEMEKGFRDYFFEKSIKILRIELLFVIFLYAIFGSFFYAGLTVPITY